MCKTYIASLFYYPHNLISSRLNSLYLANGQSFKLPPSLSLLQHVSSQAASALMWLHWIRDGMMGHLGSHSPAEFLLVSTVGLYLYSDKSRSVKVEMDPSLFGALCQHSLPKSGRAVNYRP